MLYQDTPEASDAAQTIDMSSPSATVAEGLGFLDNAQVWIRNDGLEWLSTAGFQLLVQGLSALAIFVVGRWVAKRATSMLKGLLKRRGVDGTLIGFVGSMAYMLLLTFVVIAALGQAGIDTTGLAAVIAAASFAIGFALQGSLGNFAAGVMMMIFRPIKLGDFVEAGGAVGVVEEIGVFATVMKTGDNKRIIIPNAGVTGSNITNYSTNPTRRIDLVIGIGYGDDIGKAKALLKRICEANTCVLKDPETTIGVVELGDNAVNIVCRPWVNSGDYWPTHFALLEKIKTEFDAAGISFPYPQQDVHMHNVS
ncbi:MAG: small conductance mechanosensitive channel [Chlamydiales bacterium]|jgi:small conductance mechanosensitive channel